MSSHAGFARIYLTTCPGANNINNKKADFQQCGGQHGQQQSLTVPAKYWALAAQYMQLLVQNKNQAKGNDDGDGKTWVG